MKSITATLISLLALTASTLGAPVEAEEAAAAAGQTISVSHDQKYDVGTSSLTTVACSDGDNGLINRGYTNFNSLPSFPRIGGAPTVNGWNSPNCGKCYKIHYSNPHYQNTIFVTAVDAAPGGFNLGLNAMNLLTNNRAVELGRVDAVYSEADPSNCGF